jgi:hypothetical protein
MGWKPMLEIVTAAANCLVQSMQKKTAKEMGT